MKHSLSLDEILEADDYCEFEQWLIDKDIEALNDYEVTISIDDLGQYEASLSAAIVYFRAYRCLTTLRTHVGKEYKLLFNADSEDWPPSFLSFEHGLYLFVHPFAFSILHRKESISLHEWKSLIEHYFYSAKYFEIPQYSKIYSQYSQVDILEALIACAMDLGSEYLEAAFDSTINFGNHELLRAARVLINNQKTEFFPLVLDKLEFVIGEWISEITDQQHRNYESIYMEFLVDICSYFGRAYEDNEAKMMLKGFVQQAMLRLRTRRQSLLFQFPDYAYLAALTDDYQSGIDYWMYIKQNKIPLPQCMFVYLINLLLKNNDTCTVNDILSANRCDLKRSTIVAAKVISTLLDAGQSVIAAKVLSFNPQSLQHIITDLEVSHDSFYSLIESADNIVVHNTCFRLEQLNINMNYGNVIKSRSKGLVLLFERSPIPNYIKSHDIENFNSLMLRQIPCGQSAIDKDVFDSDDYNCFDILRLFHLIKFKQLFGLSKIAEFLSHEDWKIIMPFLSYFEALEGMRYNVDVCRDALLD